MLKGVGIFQALLNGLMLVPISYLVCYHIWLHSKGLTTYAHILLIRERRRLEALTSEANEDVADYDSHQDL